jgi:hypothetical protein
MDDYDPARADLYMRDALVTAWQILIAASRC